MSQRQAFEWLTRLGFAARGLLYILIGVLLIGTGRAEDASGVLSYLSGGWGKWILMAMAAGFGGYGIWRLADAALAIESRGNEHEMLKRAGAAVSGAVHLYLANKSLDAIEGAARLSSSGGQDEARSILQLPGGQFLLLGIAGVLAGAGIYQLVIAGQCSFLKRLDQQAQESWVRWLGRAGYAARGIVFLIAAYFAARAALANRSSQVGGVEQVLEWLSSPMNLVLAAGLLLFGIYGLIEARHRRIHTLDAHEAKQRATEQADRLTR